MVLFSFIYLLVAFIAFPESKDSILSNEKKDMINIESSGSLGLYKRGKCVKTYGNETITSDEYSDWCSNIVSDKSDPSKNPFIQYSIKGKQMKVKKYSIRNGCCRHSVCCCAEEDGKIVDYGYCCCDLYSYSLHASNDNRTWTVLHKVEKDKTFYYCLTKTFELEKATQPFTYFRFVLDEEWPNCPKCLQINQIELYGETVASGFSSYGSDSAEEDESISIIGRVKRSE